MYKYKKKLSKQGIVIIGLTVACLLLIITNFKLQKVVAGQNDVINELLAAQTGTYFTDQESKEVPIKEKLSSIEKFIEKHLETLNAKEFIEAAEYYDIDQEIMLATFILETGWGKSDLWISSNNPGGIICTYGQCDDEYQVYENTRVGLFALAGNLAVYRDNGLNTPNEIRSMWSESQDTETFEKILFEIRGEQ